MKQQDTNKPDFNFLTDKYTKTVDNIEKKSFKKLAFMGLSIGIGLFFGMQIIHGAGSAFTSLTYSLEHSHDEERADNKLEVNRLSIKIKQISPAEFNNFLAYLKLEQNIYNEKVAFTSEIILKANAESNAIYPALSSVDLDSAKSLNNALTEHKKNIENDITKFQAIYDNITDGNLKAVSIKDITSLKSALNSYNANIFIHDTDLEKTINKSLFSDNEGNKKYNVKYKILERVKVIDQNMDNSIATFKPKM